MKVFSPKGHCTAAQATNLLAFAGSRGEDGTTFHTMRKSQAVPLFLLAAAALGTGPGCDDHRREVRNCVDDQNHIVSDQKCDHPGSYGGSYGGGPGGYRYVYGGASGGNMGDTVEGGNAEPEAGAEIVSGETGTVRGGFGSGEADASGHGSGE
jgi:hypothetical protein